MNIRILLDGKQAQVTPAPAQSLGEAGMTQARDAAIQAAEEARARVAARLAASERDRKEVQALLGAAGAR